MVSQVEHQILYETSALQLDSLEDVEMVCIADLHFQRSDSRLNSFWNENKIVILIWEIPHSQMLCFFLTSDLTRVQGTLRDVLGWLNDLNFGDTSVPDALFVSTSDSGVQGTLREVLGRPTFFDGTGSMVVVFSSTLTTFFGRPRFRFSGWRFTSVVFSISYFLPALWMDKKWSWRRNDDYGCFIILCAYRYLQQCALIKLL